MKTKNKDLIMQNKIFLWLIAGIGIILMIPLVAMQVSHEVDWDETDFIIIGSLLFIVGSMFIIAARKITKTSHRIAIGLGLTLMLMYIWAELAVGIFTNWGS